MEYLLLGIRNSDGNFTVIYIELGRNIYPYVKELRWNISVSYKELEWKNYSYVKQLVWNIYCLIYGTVIEILLLRMVNWFGTFTIMYKEFGLENLLLGIRNWDVTFTARYKEMGWIMYC